MIRHENRVQERDLPIAVGVTAIKHVAPTVDNDHVPVVQSGVRVVSNKHYTGLVKGHPIGLFEELTKKLMNPAFVDSPDPAKLHGEGALLFAHEEVSRTRYSPRAIPVPVEFE